MSFATIDSEKKEAWMETENARILGKDRVMMGAVYAAGKRDGSVIRAMVSTSLAAPFGEVDGKITPRLKRLTGILRQAGFKAKASTNIVDFQTTHAVGWLSSRSLP